MAKIFFRDSTEVSDFQAPYIVAEINTSHFGNIDIAKEMVDCAKRIGCDCVKFQSWSADSLYSQAYYNENPIAKRMFEKFSFSKTDLKVMAEYCKKIGISFASTPYSEDEVKFLLEECDVPFIKIASMDLNNYPYLYYIASTGTPIILSTGMGEIAEIEKAVKIIGETGNKNLCILHCTSVYPSKPDILQLRNILGLREKFPDYAIGYSDHSVGVEIASAAVAMGACLIEKHFTLDNKKIGMDNQMATEPDEMSQLIRNCKNVQLALGNVNRMLLPEEYEQRKKMRRSIIASRDLKSGTTLTLNDLSAKRPGTGMPPEKMDELIGKILQKDIKSGMLINESDIYW